MSSPGTSLPLVWYLLVHHPRPTHKPLPVSVSVPKAHGVLQLAVRFPYVRILRALVPSPEPSLGSHEFLETVSPGFSGVLCPGSAGAHTVSSHSAPAGTL